MIDHPTQTYFKCEVECVRRADDLSERGKLKRSGGCARNFAYQGGIALLQLAHVERVSHCAAHSVGHASARVKVKRALCCGHRAKQQKTFHRGRDLARNIGIRKRDKSNQFAEIADFLLLLCLGRGARCG